MWLLWLIRFPWSSRDRIKSLAEPRRFVLFFLLLLCFLHVFPPAKSAPEWAGLIALLNDIRMSKKLPLLGFINTRLYATGGAGLYDITNVRNICGWFSNRFVLLIVLAGKLPMCHRPMLHDRISCDHRLGCHDRMGSSSVAKPCPDLYKLNGPFFVCKLITSVDLILLLD